MVSEMFTRLPTVLSSVLRRRIHNHPILEQHKQPHPCPVKSIKDYEKTSVSPAFQKLKRTQKKFQADDGLPIWLKAGTRDKILYQLTLLGMAAGMALSFETIYTLIMRNFP